MTTAIIFDLDDTLIHSALKTRGKVPRQTFHALRQLKLEGVAIAVISANFSARFFVMCTGLSLYVAVLPVHRVVPAALVAQVVRPTRVAVRPPRAFVLPTGGGVALAIARG